MATVRVVDDGPPDGADRPMSGLPPLPGRAPASRSAPPVRWLAGGARLAVTTWGSSSAPAVVTGARAEGRRLTSTAERRNPGGGVISADLGPYVTVIETPSGLDPNFPVVVALGGQEYDLPPASEQQGDPYLQVEPARPPPGW